MSKRERDSEKIKVWEIESANTREVRELYREREREWKEWKYYKDKGDVKLSLSCILQCFQIISKLRI